MRVTMAVGPFLRDDKGVDAQRCTHPLFLLALTRV